MSKIKALFGVTVMVGLLAITASSASALFSSEKGTTSTGKGSANLTVFEDEGSKVECTSAVGTWKLTKGSRGHEVATGTEAENLNIHVNSSNASPAGWAGCSVVGLGTLNEVSGCDFQIKQTAKGQKKVLGSVVKGCNIKAKAIFVGECSITVPEGPENEGLKLVEDENSGNNLLSKVNVEGITSKAVQSGGSGTACKAGGIANLTNKVGKEKGEVTGEGVKEV